MKFIPNFDNLWMFPKMYAIGIKKLNIQNCNTKSNKTNMEKYLLLIFLHN